MYWIDLIVLSFFLCKSYAQLTSPAEAVCVGKQVVLVCQQTGSTLRWGVDLPGGTRNELSIAATSSQIGRVLTFINDPGFGFEIHILSSSSVSSIISELRVTAVRQLNGTTVECVGNSGNLLSTIQIASIYPPPAPSRVMTTADQSQFTPSTASITLTWSASSGADNYTIMVTPLLPSRQSLISTTTTSLQLTVLYNEGYSINVTAQNCAGSNSTVVPLTVVGCSPPYPPANGSISEYSSGAVGAILTFQCDTGYMPQEEVTVTCQSNRIWVPVPECEVVDCGAPFVVGVIEPYIDTKFGALITFHCKERNNQMTAVCSGNGEWYPDPASPNCKKKAPDCGAPLNATGVIIEPFNDTKLGALITFHCEESDNSMMSVCGSNREWIPNPASLKCGDGSSGTGPSTSENSDALSTETLVIIIAAIVSSFTFLLLGLFLGCLLYHCIIRQKDKYVLTNNTCYSIPSSPAISPPVVYEEVPM